MKGTKCIRAFGVHTYPTLIHWGLGRNAAFSQTSRIDVLGLYDRYTQELFFPAAG